MAKYRKKPVIIDAEQFFPNVHPWPSGVERDVNSPTGFGIFTLENTQARHEVAPGDWIITGVQNERYPCKAAIFAATYEPVPD